MAASHFQTPFSMLKGKEGKRHKSPGKHLLLPEVPLQSVAIILGSNWGLLCISESIFYILYAAKVQWQVQAISQLQFSILLGQQDYLGLRKGYWILTN